MGIALKSIPYEKVEYFNGEALVLSITREEYHSLRSDLRFQWQRYPNASDSNVKLFDWQFIDSDKYDVLVCQRGEDVGSPNVRWLLFGLDKTRNKFVMCVDEHWQFFGDNHR